MTLFFYVGDSFFEIGSPDFLFSFFSTIAYRLENKKWGSIYYNIMKRLYRGRLDYHYSSKALKELIAISSELKSFNPNQIVWDYDHPNNLPPWGQNISSDITDLSNYFVTSDGNDLIKVMITVLKESIIHKEDIFIK